jgi:hypothetical protein
MIQHSGNTHSVGDRNEASRRLSESSKEEREEFLAEIYIQRGNLKSLVFISLFLLLAVDKTNIITRYYVY